MNDRCFQAYWEVWLMIRNNVANTYLVTSEIALQSTSMNLNPQIFFYNDNQRFCAQS